MLIKKICMIFAMLELCLGYPIRNLSLPEYKQVSRENFRAFQVTGNIEKWLGCFGNFIEESNRNLGDGNRMIQNVDPSHILSLLQGLMFYRNYVIMTIYDCKPCGTPENEPDLSRIKKMLEDINWQALMKNLYSKFDKVMKDFQDVRDFWERQELNNYGFSIGKLLVDCLAL